MLLGVEQISDIVGKKISFEWPDTPFVIHCASHANGDRCSLPSILITVELALPFAPIKTLLGAIIHEK